MKFYTWLLTDVRAFTARTLVCIKLTTYLKSLYTLFSFIHSFDDKSCPVSVCKCDEVFRPSIIVSASPEEHKQTDCRIYINVFDEYLTITPSLFHVFHRLIWNSKAEEQWFELNMFAACEVIGISWSHRVSVTCFGTIPC